MEAQEAGVLDMYFFCIHVIFLSLILCLISGRC